VAQFPLMVYFNIMKTLLTLFVLLFSSSLVAEQKISDFSYLYEHPNSHYFFTCGAGKLNIFGGSSCGLI